MIVSNTSPIYNLSTIGQLDLLRQLYGVIYIPQAVLTEITNVGNTDSSALIVPTLDWIKPLTCGDLNLVQTLRQVNKLDLGESEAIALSLQLKAERLIIDERLGRKVALSFELKITGVLGVILAAKNKGLVSSIKPLLNLLITRTGFRLSQALYFQALAEAGEES